PPTPLTPTGPPAANRFDSAEKRGAQASRGAPRMLSPGTELIIDGGVRHKHQEAAFFSAFGADFDSGFKATLTTYSLTPRLSSQHDLAGMPAKLLTGIDVYDSIYGSHPHVLLCDPPNH